MLIKFKVGNFLSFNQIQELSLVSGTPRSKKSHVYNNGGKLNLLKFTSIFGANASGKSNLIKGLSIFKHITVLGVLPSYISNFYNRNTASNKSKKSYFEIEVTINNKYYAYGFEILLHKNIIASEWLTELKPNNDNNIIFERNLASKKTIIGSCFKKKDTINKLNIYADDIKEDPSILFLTVMNRNKIGFYNDNNDAIILQKIYKWIENSLDINSPQDSPLGGLKLRDNDITQINKIISSFDTGISNIKKKEISKEEFNNIIPPDIVKQIEMDINMHMQINENLPFGGTLRILNNMFIIEKKKDVKIKIYRLLFNHIHSNSDFEYSEESDGTIRLLDLLEILLASNTGITFIVDEIDRCLHPQLTKKFIETYLNLAEDRKIQLIVTSHESRLLDLSLLRRDEIWLTNIDKEGNTELYSLDDYNVRFDCKLDKAYLEGRYDGVPVFNKIFK